jgi:hypothetical protein
MYAPATQVWPGFPPDFVPMDRHPVSLLMDYLSTQPRVWVRAAANRLDGDWQLSLLEVTVGEPPPGWRRQRWNYEHAVFVASAPAGRTVAMWLARERIALPSPSIKLQLEGSVGVERRDSRFQGIYQQLPWPTQEWTVYVGGSSGQVLHDELVAANTPVFISFDHAAAAFFCVPVKPNRNFSGREIVVRQQDRRARIDNVLVRPTELLVEVSGKQLRGTSLTLGGAVGPTRPLSARTRQIRLPIPEGLGVGAWLALHRDRELLDRRILDPAWGGRDFEVEVDVSTRVEVLISSGEQATVEFKRELPGSNPAKVMKTVAAFANGGGGAILFGVEDDGEIVGVGEHYNPRSLDRLTNLISDWVRPLPDFECAMVDVGGRGVIAINVVSGSAAPYGVGKGERNISYYVRRAGNTFPATPADVRAFVETRVSASPAPYFPTRTR